MGTWLDPPSFITPGLTNDRASESGRGEGGDDLLWNIFLYLLPLLHRSAGVRDRGAKEAAAAAAAAAEKKV